MALLTLSMAYRKNRYTIHPTTFFMANRKLICISCLTCLVYINQKSRHTSHSIYFTYEQQENNLQQSLCFDWLEERSTCKLIFKTIVPVCVCCFYMEENMLISMVANSVTCSTTYWRCLLCSAVMSHILYIFFSASPLKHFLRILRLHTTEFLALFGGFLIWIQYEFALVSHWSPLTLTELLLIYTGVDTSGLSS